jgi:hypothetical protein
MISGMIGLVGLFLHPEVMQKMCAQWERDYLIILLAPECNESKPFNALKTIGVLSFLSKAGHCADMHDVGSGWDDIITRKVLKNIG